MFFFTSFFSEIDLEIADTYKKTRAGKTLLTGASVMTYWPFDQTRALAIEFGLFLVKADVDSYLPLSSIESESKWGNLERAWKDD
jgi:hypothetical protein